MKKIILFVFFITLFTCCKQTEQQEATIYDPKVEKKEEPKKAEPKYKVGDVVYTKPDSTRAVIIDMCLNCSKPYLKLVSIYQGVGRTTENVALTSIY